MDQNSPQISVVIVSYNFERYLEEAIQSVVNQTLKPMEIIICDDCSTDRSGEIIQRFAQQYPDWIVPILQPRNLGPHENARVGFQRTRGSWISALDGDDRWHSRKLEAEWQALQRIPGAQIAYSNVNVINESGDRVDTWVLPGEPRPPEGDVFRQVFAKRFFGRNRAIYRNELIQRSLWEQNPQDPAIPVHLDWDMRIRETATAKVAYSEEIGVDYRIHSEGIHRKLDDRIGESIRKVFSKNVHLLEMRSMADALYVCRQVNDLLISRGAAPLENMRTTRPGLPIPKPADRPVRMINSLPKSGTYLLRKLMQLMGFEATPIHISKQLTGFRINGTPLERTIPAGVDWPEPIAPEAVRHNLGQLRNGQFGTAHMPYSEAFGAVLENMGARTALILRDPRDVTVSHARYVAEEPSHFLYKLYQPMTWEERLMASIIGIRQAQSGGPMLLNIRQRWESVMPWLDQDYNYTTTFEDMVGPQGGGDAETQMGEIQRFAEHFDVNAQEVELQKVADNLFGGTTTFRKGKIGKWREHFQPEHVETFKELAGDILIQLGYETDLNW